MLHLYPSELYFRLGNTANHGRLVALHKGAVHFCHGTLTIKNPFLFLQDRKQALDQLFSSLSVDHFKTIPTNDDWQTFWLELNRLNIWEWPPVLRNRSIKDGFVWCLEIRYTEHQHVTCRGSSSAPADFGEFCAVVNDLIGSPSFFKSPHQ